MFTVKLDAQSKTIEFGIPIYFFPEWNIKQVERSNIGQLYYSSVSQIKKGKRAFRYSIDANLVLLSYQEMDRVDRVLERVFFCSNILIGTNFLKPNKHSAFYFNTGIAIRVGEEFYRSDFEGYSRSVYVPGINLSMDYVYQPSKHIVIHPMLGVNFFPQKTYQYSYAGLNVGWAFGKKEK